MLISSCWHIWTISIPSPIPRFRRTAELCWALGFLGTETSDAGTQHLWVYRRAPGPLMNENVATVLSTINHIVHSAVWPYVNWTQHFSFSTVMRKPAPREVPDSCVKNRWIKCIATDHLRWSSAGIDARRSPERLILMLHVWEIISKKMCFCQIFHSLAVSYSHPIEKKTEVQPISMLISEKKRFEMTWESI